MNPNGISTSSLASVASSADDNVNALRLQFSISCNSRSRAVRLVRRQRSTSTSTSSLTVTLTMLTSACVLLALAVCSPHHRIRHSHHLHHGDDLGQLEYATENGTGNQTSTSMANTNDDVDVYEVAYPGQTGLPPAYLTLMYESMVSRSKYIHRKHRTATVDGMESEEMEEQPDESQKAPIIRAVMRVQIATSVRNSKIEYTLNQKSLGDFNRANIILTLKDEVSLADDDSLLTVIVSIKDYEVKHSLKIREGSKFYSFDVTSLLKNNVQDGGDVLEQAAETDSEEEGTSSPAGKGTTLRVECYVTEPGTGKSRQFSEIFDTNAEAPFILLRFQHIHLTNGVRPSHHRGNEKKDESVLGQTHRKKRSPQAQADPTLPTVTATGIPGISSQKDEPIGSCTCPNPTHHAALSFLPLPTAAMLPVPDFRSELDSAANSPRYEYEVTPTGPSSGNGKSDHYPLPFNISFATGTPSNKSRSYSARRYAVSKLTLSGPNAQGASPRPYSSKTPTSPTVCKRHEWMVRPSDISLEDVIRPEYLDLGYCAGTCPFPLRNDVYNYTMHSYFVDQHRFFNGFATPANLEHSKCIPVTYKKLMVMLKEPDGGFAVIVYDDASVETCGCR